MARPRKNNAEYFSHDASLRNDLKIKALRSKYNSDGYATYCILLEILTDADNFQIKDTELNRLLIAGDIGIELDLFENILDTMDSLDLIQMDGEFIWNANLLERMQPVLNKRKIMQENYQVRGGKPKEETPPPAEEPKPPKPERVKKALMGEEEWEIFKNRFPKKESVYKAKEKFMKLEKSLFPDIQKWLDLYDQSDKWQRGFLHMATTWINGRLWLDTPTPYTPKNNNWNQHDNAKKTWYSDNKV